MKKIERLVGIIYALKENKKMTAKQIADMFEVSERTIYRDIDALCQLSIPIKAFEGYEGGYTIDKNYFVPTISFTNNEILYLLISLKMGDNINVPNMKPYYESLKFKLLNILDNHTKQHYSTIIDKIKFNVTSMSIFNYHKNIIEKITDSFYKEKDLQIKYYSPKKGIHRTRRISPQFLCFYSGGWYLYSYCHLRGDYAYFRLDRIKECYLLDSQKAIPANLLNQKEKTKIIINISDTLYDTMSNDTIFKHAIITKEENIIKLEFESDDISEVTRLALRNPNDITVIEPQQCINEIKDICNILQKKY